MMKTNYDKCPVVQVTQRDEDCAADWQAISGAVKAAVSGRDRGVLVIECYPGVDLAEIERELVSRLHPDALVRAADALKDTSELEAQFAETLGDDPVFAKMRPWTIADFLSAERVEKLRGRVRAHAKGLMVVLGTGAAQIAQEWDVLVYADLARWEIQRRQRAHEIGNLGANNADASARELYKRAFFIDWRAADRVRQEIFEKIDFFLDTNIPHDPRMIAGELYRAGLKKTCTRPFRVAPFFDPGPWGGEWMRRHFDLPQEPPNFAWCFDCVPEENSLRLGFGSRAVELPALTLVHQHPEELLGAEIYQRFGAEFPIRFDFLDTVGGGNLSLQVHPLMAFIREKFGLTYTQDESYYLLDAGPGAVVYLGLKEGIDRAQMEQDLRVAQTSERSFPAETYVNTWPVEKHSHVSIPAGTIHCSGKNGMVLEISATPYIFTFKLWDWDRVDLDGKPRPIHLDYGIANIQWDRTTEWVRKNLVNPVRPIASGPGWREESTGLYKSEFIETRRHWFTTPVEHDTQGNLNVLNLVEGEQVVVESPTNAFEPFVAHYAETFIVPAAVGKYRISPIGEVSAQMATIKAYVRAAVPS
ncbi:MAG: class I mannose-6-phosphate isomerase [Acidobacteriaceae bacterium]